MLAAAEVAMMQTAEDDAERARIRAPLYAPPPRRQPAAPGPPRGVPSASAVLAQVAAEDAEIAAMRQRGR
jgi:hypothetical protein